VTLFLCGDVMTARGIDQVLPHPGDPELREPVATSARQYVALAEQASGPIPRPVDFAYPWGAALQELERVRPDVRIVNLETSVTRSGAWADKSIHYRMHPENVPVLTAAGIDCCVLANNHVLDLGPGGLVETLDTLQRAGLATSGAGRDRAEAEAPAILDLGAGRRVLIFSFGSVTSGIPREWSAAEDAPGISLLEGTDVRSIAARVQAIRRPGDLVVASIHWGGNWGYEIPDRQRSLAHALVEQAGVDLLHGHSSHHFKAVELHQGRPILYGCGDFLNDYEGIGGREAFRAELALMYFATLDVAARKLERLEVVPLRIVRLRLERPSPEDARWVRERLDRECRRFGVRVGPNPAGGLDLTWG
jgi:poly-gamma-glutamate synthesis protein (capsule biosynthesis protein)